MPNGPTLAVIALTALYVFNGVRCARGDDSAVPVTVKPANLMFVQGLGYHMLMDVCFMIGVVVNDIAHVMMPAFVAAMLIVVSSHFIIDDLPGAAPAAACRLSAASACARQAAGWLTGATAASRRRSAVGCAKARGR